MIDFIVNCFIVWYARTVFVLLRLRSIRVIVRVGDAGVDELLQHGLGDRHYHGCGGGVT